MKTSVIPFDYQGQPVHFNADGWINATVVAERFGKKPAHWLELESTKEYIQRLSQRVASNVGKTDITLVKTRRGNSETSGTWLHPKLAVKFARWLSVDFEIWCDEQIDQLIREGGGQSWAQARSELSATHSALCEALKLCRADQGKTTEAHHYANEARLINQVIAQTFGGRTREQLTPHELNTATRLESWDMVLLGKGLSYAERKAALLNHALELQNKSLRSVAAA